jgi:hypothetical protein
MSFGMPRSLEHLVDDAPDRRQHHEALLDRRRNERKQARIDPHRHQRCMRGFGKQVHHLADALGLGVGQVKALAVLIGLVGDMIHRPGDEIDRHEVDAAALQPQPASTAACMRRIFWISLKK